MCKIQASIKYIIELLKRDFKSQYNSMQNIAYWLKYMKFYFQENGIHNCEKNRFYEVQSSSLINITFIMRENLYNARCKSKIKMHMI